MYIICCRPKQYWHRLLAADHRPQQVTIAAAAGSGGQENSHCQIAVGHDDSFLAREERRPPRHPHSQWGRVLGSLQSSTPSSSTYVHWQYTCQWRLCDCDFWIILMNYYLSLYIAPYVGNMHMTVWQCGGHARHRLCTVIQHLSYRLQLCILPLLVQSQTAGLHFFTRKSAALLLYNVK